MNDKKPILGPVLSQTFSYAFGKFGNVFKAAGIPMVFVMGIMIYFYFPSTIHFIEMANEAEVTNNETLVLEAVGGMFGSIALLFIACFVFYPMVGTAIMRNILTGEPPKFLTFDRDVWRVLGALVILALIWFAVIIGISMVAVIPIGMTAAGDSAATTILLAFIMELAVIAALLMIMTKTSLVLPDVVASSRLRISHGMRLTKGYFWPLLGTYLLAGILITLVSYFAMAVAIIIAGIGADTQGLLTTLTEDESGAGAVKAMVALAESPLGVVAMLVYTLSAIFAAGANFALITYSYMTITSPQTDSLPTED